MLQLSQKFFGDGQKLTGVILEYPMAINGKKIKQKKHLKLQIELF